MARPFTLRIAIADGEHARFVQPDGDNVLRTVNAIDSASAHQRSHDLGTDQPGRSFESSGSARHSVGERSDLHTTEKERFVRVVAGMLNAASALHEFDELLLVAPPRALLKLRDELDVPTAAKLVGTLDKDLVKTPDSELWPHVSEWVSAAVRRPIA